MNTPVYERTYTNLDSQNQANESLRRRSRGNGKLPMQMLGFYSDRVQLDTTEELCQCSTG